MIRRVFNRILVIIILAALVVGSSGIHIRIHDCSGSKKKDYLAYPEFQSGTKGGCCAVDPKSKDDHQSTQTRVKKTACCKLNTITLKVNPFEHQYTTQASVLIAPEFPSLLLSDEALPADDTNIVACNSPPNIEPEKLSGKELVYYINQLRIPSAC